MTDVEAIINADLFHYEICNPAGGGFPGWWKSDWIWIVGSDIRRSIVSSEMIACIYLISAEAFHRVECLDTEE